MKKSLIIALGAIAMVACTKTTVDYEPTGEIKFAPVTRVNTKAAVETTVFPAEWNMIVYGYYDKSAPVGSTYQEGTFSEVYLDSVLFAKKGDYWAGSPKPYYWPKTGSILFAAVAPSTFSQAAVKHDFKSNTFSVAKMEQLEDFSECIDLLYAPYDKSRLASVVDMPFYHAFTWLTIKAQAAAEINVKIKSIKLLGMAKEAVADTLPTWKSSGTKDLTVFSTTETDGVAVPSADFKEFANAPKSVLLLPQSLTSNAKLEITYSMDKGDGTYVEQAPFVVAFENIQTNKKVSIDKFEAGKHYVYDISFGATTEILIKPEVKPWDEVTMDNISATNTTKGGGE